MSCWESGRSGLAGSLQQACSLCHPCLSPRLTAPAFSPRPQDTWLWGVLDRLWPTDFSLSSLLHTHSGDRICSPFHSHFSDCYSDFRVIAAASRQLSWRELSPPAALKSRRSLPGVLRAPPSGWEQPRREVPTLYLLPLRAFPFTSCLHMRGTCFITRCDQSPGGRLRPLHRCDEFSLTSIASGPKGFPTAFSSE